MHSFLSCHIAKFNSILNELIWGILTPSLLVTTGVVLTLFTKGFQFTHFGHAMRHSIGSIGNRSSHTHAEHSVSPFQAICTALSATLGTGNISGIAYAITMGGPGAVLWMWIAALLGMITGFAEKVLGIYYRRRSSSGEWCGGPMYYLQDGLGSKKGCKTLGKLLAIMFAAFTILASFGIGNLSQVVSIRESIMSLRSFTGDTHLDAFLIGVFIAIISAFVILGGLNRIAKTSEKLVPFMACFYVLGAVVIITLNRNRIIPALFSILRHAFSFRAAAGGIGGAVIKKAITWGFKRGIFSNEAGLGSSVIAHSASDTSEPVIQGFWGMFEVFFDTIVLCTITALLILTSGVVDLDTGKSLLQVSCFQLTSKAFEASFGVWGGIFIAMAISLFAIATILGWNYYGTKACEYLFGIRSTVIYNYIYIAVILLGCTLNVDLIIGLSDVFNGLMAIPNLIGVLSLTRTVLAILDNYKRRTLDHDTTLKPMLNYAEAAAQTRKQSFHG